MNISDAVPAFSTISGQVVYCRRGLQKGSVAGIYSNG
jgi:hypothetical protein